MRDHGREGRNGDEASRIAASVTVRGTGTEEAPRDLVFDFSDLDDMSVQDLSVLLTAQRMATEEDRAVWATGVARETWHALHALGLEEYFRPFPTAGDREA